jgi:HD-GYP domain-containing protein (c-di-GMP phosphodiesterase class II)
MATERTQHTPQDALALSHDDLCRLLAEKEQEANQRLAEELNARCRQIQFQESLAERMGRVTDLFELSNLILEELRAQLGGEQALLAIVTETQFLEVVATTEPMPQRYQIDLIEEAFVAGETLSLSADDPYRLQTPGADPLPEGVPLLAVPLFKHDGKPLGVLFVEGALRPDRVDWLEPFLAQIAVALEDCEHYLAIEGQIFDAALAIAEAHECRMPKQKGHTRRVEELARQLCRALGLGATEEKHIRLLALIHDMSPEAVAKAFSAIKRGKLSAKEWQDLMAEPFQGGIYASPLADFQRVIAELAYLRCRWDGKGNSPAVAGEGIPLAARVVAIAEAFENLTGSRSHRTTLPIPQALGELNRFSGSLYDPRVIAALNDQFAQSELVSRVAFLPVISE